MTCSSRERGSDGGRHRATRGERFEISLESHNPDARNRAETERHSGAGRSNVPDGHRSHVSRSACATSLCVAAKAASWLSHFFSESCFVAEFEKKVCVDREETAARTVVGTRHGQATASAARRTETGPLRGEIAFAALFSARDMGVDPWADENDEHESRGGQGDSSDEGASELEREARRRREQVRADGRSRASPDPAPTADARGSLFPSLASPPLADLRSRDRHPAVLERGVPRGLGGG
jgi:hypothetical protein